MVNVVAAGNDDEHDPTGGPADPAEETSLEAHWPSDATPRWVVAALVALLVALAVWAVVASL